MNYEMGGSGNGCAIEENRIFVQKCFDGVVYSLEHPNAARIASTRKIAQYFVGFAITFFISFVLSGMKLSRS